MPKYSHLFSKHKIHYQIYNQKYWRIWYSKHRRERKEYFKRLDQKEYRIKFKRERRKTEKERIKIRLRSKKYERKRRRENPSFRISSAMKTAVWKSLRGGKKYSKWEDLVGYKFKDLKKHLGNQFNKNMNWKNYGSYWSIDHIKPISLFNFSSAKEKSFRECWGLQNLRPLENAINFSKRNKF